MYPDLSSIVASANIAYEEVGMSEAVNPASSIYWYAPSPHTRPLLTF